MTWSHFGCSAYDTVLQNGTTGLNDVRPQEMMPYLPLYDSKKCSKKSQTTIYPHLPNTIQDIIFDGTIGQTLGDKCVLLCDNHGRSENNLCQWVNSVIF